MERPSGKSRPQIKDGAETRRRIKLAAVKHISTVGYANATIRTIAKEANVTSSTIYHHFPSKEALVAEILHSDLNEPLARIHAAVQREPTLSRRLVAVLKDLNAYSEEHSAIIRFESSIDAELSRHPELLAAQQVRHGAHTQLYLDLTGDAVASGELSSHIDREALADALIAIESGLARLSVTVTPDRHRAAIHLVEAAVSDWCQNYGHCNCDVPTEM